MNRSYICFTLQIFICTLLFYIFYSPSTQSIIWKGPKSGLSEDGLLPYQICGSSDPYVGAGIVDLNFLYRGDAYRMVITASSSWGASAKLPRVEFLAYYKTGEGLCPKDSGGHCEILPRGGPVIAPLISCRNVQQGFLPRSGYFAIPAEKALKERYDGVFYVVNIICPSLELDLSNHNANHIEICIAQDNKAPACATIKICYRHVSSIRRASLCLEPIFGISSKTEASLAYWKGVTPAWPNGYHGHTLLDSFLKYHVNILGLHVTVNTYSSDEFLSHVTKYLGPDVAYRPGWDLPVMGGSSHYADWEVLAEATCQWEHRLDSRWVIVGYAPDNFIFPRTFGETLNDVLDRIDSQIYSGLEIPVMLSFSSYSLNDEGNNVLRRWRVLDLDDDKFLGSRGVTLYNPRHTTHSCIHWNHARTDNFKQNRIGMDVVNNLSISVVHIMGMTRPSYNQIDTLERQDLQPSFDELGRRLEEILAI